MKSTDYKAELDQMYSTLGVLNVPLEIKCKYSNSCWKGIEHRMWNEEFEGIAGDEDEYCAHLSAPWIGDSYGDLKLLVIGINLYNYGGYKAQERLINNAKTKILLGHKKIKTGNSEYVGSVYWHRIPVYVAPFLEKANLLKPTWSTDHFPIKEDLVKAFSFISLTNSVKCSPQTLPEIANDRSKPSGNMWENCSKYVLKEEIEILKPEKILIVGTSDNLEYFKKNILDNPCNFKNFDAVLKGLGKVNGREIEIFVVPHTAAYGGSKKTIVNSLIQALTDI